MEQFAINQTTLIQFEKYCN